MAAKFYKQIKIMGFIMFIPLILAAGPLTGYFVGAYLEKYFSLSSYVSLIGAAIGFAAAVQETVRIIRLIIKIDKESA